MSKPDRQKWKAFSKLLSERQKALRTEIAEELRGSDDPRTVGVAQRMAEQGDWAVADVEAELEIAMAVRDINELREVESALARIDDGSFGQCVDCGQPIPEARLTAYPIAKRCLPCQQEIENRQGQTPPTL